MRKLIGEFLAVAVASLVIAGSVMAWAPEYVSENWDGYTSGGTPYEDRMVYGPNNSVYWELRGGALMELTGGALSSPHAYRIPAGSASKISYNVDFDGVFDGNTAHDQIVLQGWMYDSGNPSTSWLGLGKHADEYQNNGLIRIGNDGGSTYKVQYGKVLESEGLMTVDTGMPISEGWHYMRVELLNTNYLGFWEATWMVGSDYQGDYGNIGPGSGRFAQWRDGSFSWFFDRASATSVILGSEYETAGTVAWDNIAAGSYDFVGAPVPEPGSILILGSGLVGLAGFVRRRR